MESWNIVPTAISKNIRVAEIKQFYSLYIGDKI